MRGMFFRSFSKSNSSLVTDTCITEIKTTEKTKSLALNATSNHLRYLSPALTRSLKSEVMGRVQNWHQQKYTRKCF